MEDIKLVSNIKSKILTLRNTQIMVDRDLALLYGIETKRLNEQVKRNIKRFPQEFMFQLTKEEKNELVANCDHLKNLKFSPTLPFAFSEQGVAMLSTKLLKKACTKKFVSVKNYVDKLIKLDKKWFGFSKMDNKSLEIIKRLEN